MTTKRRAPRPADAPDPILVSLPSAQIGLDPAWIDGEEIKLEGGVLLLQRRDPTPGVAGLKSWTANLSVAGYPLADVSRDAIEFRADGEGREF